MTLTIIPVIKSKVDKEIATEFEKNFYMGACMMMFLKCCKYKKMEAKFENTKN